MDIAKAGVAEARRLGVDAVIVDTAGRLQVWCWVVCRQGPRQCVA